MFCWLDYTVTWCGGGKVHATRSVQLPFIPQIGLIMGNENLEWSGEVTRVFWEPPLGGFDTTFTVCLLQDWAEMCEPDCDGFDCQWTSEFAEEDPDEDGADIWPFNTLRSLWAAGWDNVSLLCERRRAKPQSTGP
jgi:hypothetical protein